MNEDEKKQYKERYKNQKEKGVPFFPDVVFKDAVVSLVIFLVLAALAYFLGVPTEARADPNDAAYTPRPEWYFLFLFQLLKYFPGRFEVIGVVIIPTLLILLLLTLPFLDRNPRRHFLDRPIASIVALLVVAGIGTLTLLSVLEEPPPQVASTVDQASALYVKNCANCHGATVGVPPSTDLHEVIAQGKHEGMPAWGGDLSTDEIDALAGFITSPKGSALYTQYCGECHRGMVQASGDPQSLQRVFTEGGNYPPHRDQGLPDWELVLTDAPRNALLNFLAAPDGQRLFEINCSGCHGSGVAFKGDATELQDLISEGGQHLAMPAWKGTLSDTDVEILAGYVSDPTTNPAGEVLFGQHCAACHGDRVPSAPDMNTARKIINGGGAHVTMPEWGKILTSEQLDALVQYTAVTAGTEGGREGPQLYAANCAACHGNLGQGGPNPALAGDMISPISSAEYLETRDDTTLRNIISQGQPNLGMSPFGSAFGGPLSDEEVDSVVDYLRSWQANPPEIEAPTPAVPAPLPQIPSAAEATFSGSIQPILQARCQACHNSSNPMGGWDASSYDTVIHTGESGEAVIAGDVESSLLARLIQGIGGESMPPGGTMSMAEIEAILYWISSGAMND